MAAAVSNILADLNFKAIGLFQYFYLYPSGFTHPT